MSNASRDGRDTSDAWLVGHLRVCAVSLIEALNRSEDAKDSHDLALDAAKDMVAHIDKHRGARRTETAQQIGAMVDRPPSEKAGEGASVSPPFVQRRESPLPNKYDEHDVRARAREICIRLGLGPEKEDTIANTFEPLVLGQTDDPCPRCRWPETTHPVRERRDGEYVYVVHSITCPVHEGWMPPGRDPEPDRPEKSMDSASSESANDPMWKGGRRYENEECARVAEQYERDQGTCTSLPGQSEKGAAMMIHQHQGRVMAARDIATLIRRRPIAAGPNSCPAITVDEPDPERPDPPRAKRINYRCTRCGVAEASGEMPGEASGRLRIYPLPPGWKLVPCPSCVEDDHLHCAVCVEQHPAVPDGSTAPHNLWSNPKRSDPNDPRMKELADRVKELVPPWVIVAWLLDRREQYKPSSGTYAGFDELIGQAADGAYREAWEHGELDDLRSWAEEILAKRSQRIASPPPKEKP